MTMKDELNRPRPVIDHLNEAIRENPLAAGLIGAGVAWMLLGSKGLGVAAGVAKSAATTAGAAAGAAAAGAGNAAAAGSRAAGAIKDAASKARGAAAEAIESAPSLVPETPDLSNATAATADAGAAVGERVRAAAVSGREYGAAIQSRLSENLERQPLLLGAIGLAIGAGIAASFATTSAEQEWLGKSAAAAKDKAQELGDAVADHARHVLSEVRGEAERQGLTPDALKDAASSLGSKAKSVAEAARDTATTTDRG